MTKTDLIEYIAIFILSTTITIADICTGAAWEIILLGGALMGISGYLIVKYILDKKKGNK